jgi:signal transduction histidine kinase
VFVDETRMAQVFDNLLANAARYATTVELSAAAHEAGVNLVVSDDGPGIAEDQLETIFDRFHRVDPARSGPGAGLGLAIAGRLVELHGGTIRAERRPGAGATFVVWLPSHGVNRS